MENFPLRQAACMGDLKQRFRRQEVDCSHLWLEEIKPRALDAHFAVSRLLGHERPDVTNIYLASVRKGENHGH